jgi:hypothetical protein
MIGIIIIVAVSILTPVFLFGMFSIEKEAYDENYLQR